MKTTSKWLNSYLDEDFSPEKLDSVLTLSGTEVEHTSDSNDGTVLQLEVTSNRVDCLGVRGLVREVAAVTGTADKFPTPQVVEAAGEGHAVSIDEDALEKCPQYTARIIRGVKVGPSPQWLVDRLEAIGVAAINNIVDITNLVLYEYSQPLHAFDLAKLEGGIRVRRAEAGEKFLAINHKEYELSTDDLVIADQSRAVALAGIMGGADSEISNSTTDVLLESAYFEPRGVKATGRRMDKQHSENLDSDSRYRFERGVDPCGIKAASHRAIELILELAGGEVAGPLTSAGSAADPWLRELTLRAATVERTMGAPIAIDEMARILAALGLEVSAKSDDALSIKVPSFRRDLVLEIDLVEEIGRVVGLENFESRLTLPIAQARANLELEDRKLAAEILLGCGVNEAWTDTFVADKGVATLTPWETGPALRARSPVNTHWPCIRRSLMPSLARVIGENHARSSRDVAFFEMATLTLTDRENKPATKSVVAIAGVDFFATKGVVQEFLTRMGVSDVEWQAQDFGLFAKGEGLVLRVGDKVLGYLGRTSAAVEKEYDLIMPATLCELDFEVIVEARERVPMLAPIPRFPTVDRDLAVVVEDAITWEQINQAVHAVDAPHLKGVTFFDEFRGKQIPKGKKSLAFAMVFRDDTRTLVSEEVDDQVKAIIESLTTQCGAEVRS